MNTTKQRVIIGNSNKLDKIKNKSVNLIITSPPYPMIKMWDDLFNSLNNKITQDLIETKPKTAFELMHKELEKIYDEAIKKLTSDAYICINIGDATRTCNNFFSLYPNGSRTISYFTKKGFSLLPSIIWSKPTNSPTKFMGSGMLPVGAYNTLEYENILIFRKSKRKFEDENIKKIRRESAFFWNERNLWCSNIWNFIGVNQKNKNLSRERNGAFPIELPYRIISLLTIKNDTVLDIFGGTGTTLLACTALQRNGIIVELMSEFKSEIENRINNSINLLNNKNLSRIKIYKKFIEERLTKGKSEPKHYNDFLKIKVISSQEKEIKIPIIKNILKNEKSIDLEFEIEYN